MRTLNSKNKFLDVDVANESLILAFASSDLKGKVNPRSKKKLQSCYDDRTLVSVGLPQDDGMLVRVRRGKLTKAEQEQWVATGRSRIDLSSGQLAVCGGFSFISPKEPNDEFSETIGVKPGIYCLTVYAHLPSCIGEHLLASRRSWKGFAYYWKKTRGNGKLPYWLWELAEDSDSNLEKVLTERELRKLEDLDEDDIEPVQLLVHIEPWTKQCRESAREPSGNLRLKTRKPKLCPRGINSTLEVELNDDNGRDDESTFVITKPASADLDSLAENFMPMISALGKNDFANAAKHFPDECQIKAETVLQKLVGMSLASCRQKNEEFGEDGSQIIELGEGEEATGLHSDFNRIDSQSDVYHWFEVAKAESLLSESSFIGVLQSSYEVGPAGILCGIQLVVIQTKQGAKIARVRLWK